MSDIEFYIPEGVTIPTRLELRVDEIPVMYERIEDGFRFFVDSESEVEAMGIVEKVIDRMKTEQSDYKHGVSWRTISLEVVPQEIRYKIDTIIDWKYRVRDSY